MLRVVFVLLSIYILFKLGTGEVISVDSLYQDIQKDLTYLYYKIKELVWGYLCF